MYIYNKILINLNLNYKIMTLKLASGSYDGTIKFWDPSTGTDIPS